MGAHDLYARGLTGEGLEMICVDGGQGLLAALPTAYHGIPVQRCRVHKMCPRQGQDAVRQDLHAAAPTISRPGAPPGANAGKMHTPRPSHACATISTIC